MVLEKLNFIGIESEVMNKMGNYNFATVPKAEIQRSSFDRSHTWKGTFDAGMLIPFY